LNNQTLNKEEDYILEVNNLSQYFDGFKAVDDVSFKVKRGEVFGIVGESGCGKTTTGRSILRLYNATKGEVFFEGQRIVAGSSNYDGQIKEMIKNSRLYQKQLKEENRIDELKKEKTRLKEQIENVNYEIKQAKRDQKGNVNTVNKIQMIFQDPMSSLDPRMTIRDIVGEGLIIKGEKDKQVIDSKVAAVLEKVGLPAVYASRYPHEFSGGQRQRIGIARAIIMEPDIIIADEPVSALDVSVQAQVINLLDDIRKEMGLTVIFIAHDLSVVKYFCDRIMVMYKGKVMEIAPSDELFANPVHEYTKSLLSAVPLPDPEKEKTSVRIAYNPKPSLPGTTEKVTYEQVADEHYVRTVTY